MAHANENKSKNVLLNVLRTFCKYVHCGFPASFSLMLCLFVVYLTMLSRQL
jgi:hypothetical protein